MHSLISAASLIAKDVTEVSELSGEKENGKLRLKNQEVVGYRQRYRAMWSGDRLLNGVSLDIAMCYGVSSTPLQKNLYFMKNDCFLYVCGNHLMKYDFVAKAYDCLSRKSEVPITCLNYLNKKDETLYFYGEKAHDQVPVLVIYNPKRNQKINLTHDHLPVKSQITQVELAKESKKSNLCVTLTEAHVTVWMYEKQKMLAHYELRHSMKRMAVNPRNQCAFVLCGPHYLRFWEVNLHEKQLREAANPPMSLKIERENYFLDIAYVPCKDNVCIALAVPNMIFVIVSNELRHTLQNMFIIRPIKSSSIDFDDEPDTPVVSVMNRSHVESLAVGPKSIYIGGSMGYMSVYYFEGDDMRPALLGSIRIQDNVEHILSLSATPDEQSVAVVAQSVLENQDSDTDALASLTASKLDFYVLNVARLDKNVDVYTKFFPASHHFGAVRGLSASIAKNLIASIGEDKHLRLWDYESEWQGRLAHRFFDMPQAVSLHPFGVQVAVGFRESLKVFYILYDRLSAALDIGCKNCSAVAYSSSGKYLAAANGMVIGVYNAFTLKQVYALVAHSGLISSISWEHEDTMLVTTCASGFAYCWNLLNNRSRDLECSNRQARCEQASYDYDLDLFVMLSNDNTLRVYSEHGTNLMAHDTPTDCVFTCFLLAKDLQVLVLGTDRGTVQVKLWPILELRDSEGNLMGASEVVEFYVSTKAVTQLELSYDRQFLFVSSEDGSIFVLTVRQIQEGGRQTAEVAETEVFKTKNLLSSIEVMTMNALSLIPQSQLGQSEAQIKDLEEKIRTLESDKAEELRVKDEEAAVQFKALNQQHDSAITGNRKQYQELDTQIKKEREAHAAATASLKDQHEAALLSLEAKHTQRFKDELERYDRLKDDYEELKLQYSSELEEILGFHKDTVQTVETQYKQRLTEVQEAYNKMLADMRGDGEKYETIIMQIEEEYEKEIANLRAELRSELDEERSKTMKYVSDNRKLQKTCQEASQVTSDNEQKYNELDQRFKALQHEADLTKDMMNKMKDQLEERDELIKRKEATIKELRSFNIHLQNFRFVLDQKIKTLRDERVSDEDKLVRLQDDIRDMYNELLEEFSQIQTAKEDVKTLRMKSQGYKKRNEAQLHELLETRHRLTLFQSDLAQLIRTTDKDELIFKLKDLYDKHVANADLLKVEATEGSNSQDIMTQIAQANLKNVRQEILFQNDKMKTRLVAAQKTSKRLYKERSDDILRKQHENAELIKECNDLRNDKQMLMKTISALKTDLKKANSLGVVKETKLQRKPSAVKETPFVSLKKNSTVPNLSQVVSPLELYKPPKQDARKPDFRIRSMINEMDRNRKEIVDQNANFNKLREQVSKMLVTSLQPEVRIGEGPNEESSQVEESKVSIGHQRSISQWSPPEDSLRLT
jgi:WD40 repeat protein